LTSRGPIRKPATMYLGEVHGSVVATQQYEGLRGQKLLLVQPLDETKKPVGAKQVAVDTVQAGPGDVVFLVGSREACLALEETFVPVDAAIVGIVDDVHLGTAR
jgi:ethanolamine utilization protein EutN